MKKAQFDGALLVAIANPSKYPHLERHAKALVLKYKRVKILCVGDSRGFNAIPHVKYHSISKNMPVGVWGFLKLMWGFYKKIKKINARVVEAFDPPALGPAALAKNKSTFLFYMSMEYYTEQAHIKNSLKRRLLWTLIEKWAIRKSDQRATVSPGVAKLLEEKYFKKFELVRNLPPKNTKPLSPLKKEEKLLVYQGLLEPGRGIKELCEALYDSDWRLKIIGGGPLLDSLKSEFGEKVEFTGWLKYEDSLDEISTGSVGAVFIEDLGLSFRHCLPGKLFEYLHRGIPVLVSNLPDLSKMVRDFNVGEVAEFEKKSILEALLKLDEGIQQKKYDIGLLRSQNELNWEKEKENFLNLYPIEITK